MTKTKKNLAIIVAIWFVITGIGMGAFLYLGLSGTISITQHCFAVDSNGKVFVGGDSKIRVYENGKQINTIAANYKSYAIAVTPEDELYLCDRVKYTVYRMDLQGAVLEVREMRNRQNFSDEFGSIFSATQKVLVANGNVYTVRTPWLRTTIYCGTEPVYRMPLLDYVCRLFLVYFFVTLPCVVFAVFGRIFKGIIH